MGRHRNAQAAREALDAEIIGLLRDVSKRVIEHERRILALEGPPRPPLRAVPDSGNDEEEVTPT